MDKLLNLLRPLVIQNYRAPYWVLGITITIAAVAGYFALQLRIDTNLSNLLPESNEHVQALERLQNTVGGETAMEVAIQSPSFEDNKQFAQDLIQQSLKLYDDRTDNYFFERVEFKKETEILKNNALYFATGRELQDIRQYLKDEINAAKEEANPFLIDFEEEEPDTADQSEQLSQFEESYQSLIPSEYPVSEDSTVMVVKFFPTGSKSDLTYLEDMFAEYDSLLAEMNPQSYNKEMEVYFGGRLKRHLSEINSIMGDVFNSFASGISSVILLVMIYFFAKKYSRYRKGSHEEQNHGFFGHLLRVPVPVVVIGVPLLISLLWTFGLTYFVLGMLNTMTSVLFVILFGMGIDYGIHFYARYIELRSSGNEIKEALLATYDRTGSAIMVSALTTAFSLFVLVLARFRGFSEFGFIAGTGIILALFCMLFVLPSLLVLFERYGWILLNEDAPRESESKIFHRFPLARTIVIIGLIVSGVTIWNSNQIKFQYDFGELEPEFPSTSSLGVCRARWYPEISAILPTLWPTMKPR
ncbi:MAG: MMPL family transporter [Balneolaceae bacterium]|nr:MMPL family transporter [Balneolaceae bacterium]